MATHTPGPEDDQHPRATVANLRCLLRAVARLTTEARSLLPTRLLIVTRDLLWVHVLNRFSLCEIGPEQLGVRAYTLQPQDFPSVESSTRPTACIYPNLLEFGTCEVIEEIGGQSYVGKLVMQNASSGGATDAESTRQ